MAPRRLSPQLTTPFQLCKAHIFLVGENLENLILGLSFFLLSYFMLQVPWWPFTPLTQAPFLLPAVCQWISV